MGAIKDLLGERFGRRTVVDYVGIDTYGRPVWLCQCDCGTWRELTHNTLLVGKSTSCGCERKIVKLNDYVLTDDVCKCILPNGNEALFDREDYPKIAQHRWMQSDRSYVYTTIDGHNMMLHRLIMDCPDGMVVDHINHNRLDNRKCNLRICTTMQNSWNTIHPRSTDGFRGVTKRKNDWRVEITVNHERIIIGYYDTFEEAVEARLKAEQFYLGEFAPKEYDD